MTEEIKRAYLAQPWSPYGGGSPVYNQVARSGTRDDRQEYTVIAERRVTHAELRACYNAFGLAKRVVDMPPYEAMAVPPEYAGVLATLPDLNNLLVESIIVNRCFGVVYVAYNRTPENLEANDEAPFSIYRPYLLSEDEDAGEYQTVGIGRSATVLRYDKEDILTVFSGISATEAGLLGDTYTTYPPQGTSKLAPLVYLFKAYGITRSLCTEAIIQNNALHIRHRGWNYGRYGNQEYKDAIEQYWAVPSGRSVIHGPDTDEYERLFTETADYREESDAIKIDIAHNSDVPMEKLLDNRDGGVIQDTALTRDSYAILLGSIQEVEMAGILRWISERLGYSGSEDLFEFQPMTPETDEEEEPDTPAGEREDSDDA